MGLTPEEIAAKAAEAAQKLADKAAAAAQKVVDKHTKKS